MHRGGTSATMWLSAEGDTRRGATGCPGTPLYTDGCSAGKQRCLPYPSVMHICSSLPLMSLRAETLQVFPPTRA